MKPGKGLILYLAVSLSAKHQKTMAAKLVGMFHWNFVQLDKKQKFHRIWWNEVALSQKKKGTWSQFKKTLLWEKNWVEVTILNSGKVELFLSLSAVEGLFGRVRSAALPTSYGSNQA